MSFVWFTGLSSNQGEKSINFYFIRVPLRKNIKVWYSKAQFRVCRVKASSFRGYGTRQNAQITISKAEAAPGENAYDLI